ncbi:Hypothetical predicted protein [Mytilus galloprovincialis]|uniref:Uncharacterized protein n=1 Tax=Mytilus galloprovincialis TaxID=29158 RepID=A0A8B6DRH8_MYTGA|nr:Hypothetical predicted protein [Mytilus galloprovincialis]
MAGLIRTAGLVELEDKRTQETVVSNITVAATGLTATATVMEVGIARQAGHKTFAEKLCFGHLIAFDST